MNRDTVSSVGIIPRQLPFTSSNYAIKTFRHALSLDERRAKFLPNTWNTPTAREAALGFQPQPKQRPQGSSKDDYPYEPPEAQLTDVLEVWFAGSHGGAFLFISLPSDIYFVNDEYSRACDLTPRADVGGGCTAERIRLSRLTLAWMIRQCTHTSSGILFNPDALSDLGIDPVSLQLVPGPAAPTSVLNPDVGKQSVTEATEYALAEMFDQLIAQPVWWILEVIPLMQAYYHRGQKYRYFS